MLDRKNIMNKKVKCSQLKLGDLVLVWQKAFKGKHKIQDKWENTPYKVVEQKDPNLPMFHVENTGDPNKTRVLHRNMLFPLFTHDLDWVHIHQKMTCQKINSSDEESEKSRPG